MAAKRNPPPSAPARWKRHALFLGAVWIAALAAYSNSFRAGLVFDSQRVLLADSRIQADTPANVQQIWSGDYYNGTGSSALYRPLTTLTYLWNYPSGYHQANFLLHACNIALVYLLALAVLGDAWPAFALAALWALHPVLTESVTNVVGRADLLAAFGTLAGLLCYLRVAAARGWRSAAWLAGLAGASAMAVFSKESGVVLVALLAAYDLAFAPKTPWRMRMAAYLAVLLPVAGFFALRAHVLAQVSSLLISYGDNPLQGAGFWTSRLAALKVLAGYLGLLLWPAGLSADYSFNQVPVSASVPALLLWLAVAAAAVWAFRRARPVFFFLAFFAVSIAPVANLVILVGSIMAERFLYLPAVGFAGCLVWLAWRHVPNRRARAAALATVCLAMAARTWARNADWFDERSLWMSAAQVCPGSYKVHQNLAMLLLAQPQPDYPAATREVERALAILGPLPAERSMPNVYATAGQCYRARGDLPKALALLLRGRDIDREWNAAFQRVNRADGKTVGMVGTPPLYLELGRVYRDLGQPDDALEALRYGRSLDPQPAFFEELSQTYAGMNQPGQAAVSLLEEFVVYSAQPGLLNELTQLYRETVPQSCALHATAAGLTLNAACPLVHEQLCTAAHNASGMFAAMRDQASAASLAQRAVGEFGCAAGMFR